MCIYRWISTHMRKLIQFMIDCGRDYQVAIKELERAGIFLTSYQGYTITTYINRYDDKFRSVPSDNRKS